MRAHGSEHGLGNIESDILMCCETSSIRQKRAFDSIKTTPSAAYVTPKRLVWADSSVRNDASAGVAQLKHMDVREYRIL